MDENNIDKAYLSISSPGVYLTVPSRASTQNAIDLARKVNEYASGVKKQYPDRFGFFASLPLPDVQASLEEIKHCFTELDPKPDGIVMMSNYYGLYLGDPDMDPVYEALNELGVTIFEHPTVPCTEHNHQQYDIDGDAPAMPQADWRALNRPVSTRQFATPTLDFPFESARTFTDLFYSEVPKRFPGLSWIFPHAGGGLLSTVDRFVAYSILVPDFTLTEAYFRETLARSFYFDLAGPWVVDSAIPALLRWVDYTNIMWGSDVPFTKWEAGSAASDAYNEGVQEVFDNQSKVDAISRDNAVKLLG